MPQFVEGCRTLYQFPLDSDLTHGGTIGSKIVGLFTQSFGFISWQCYGWFSQNPSPLAVAIRCKLLGTRCRIDANVHIENRKNFNAAAGSALYFGTHVLNHQGKFNLGVDSHLGAYCHVNVCHGNISIGEHVAIGPHCNLIAYSNDYEAAKLVTEVRRQEDIQIGSNVFIGANCVLLPGTIIEDNVVVGANSLVKGTLVANSIYVGSPCRLIKSDWHGSS